MINETCEFCSEIAVNLCDGLIDGETCDRRLCEACSTRKGISFYCGKDVFGTGIGLCVDTTDWCPKCVKLGGNFVSSGYRSKRTLSALKSRKSSAL